jgi:hypothetical protein
MSDDRHQIIGHAAQRAGKAITEAIGEPVRVMVIVAYGDGGMRIVSNSSEQAQLSMLKCATDNIANQRQASEMPVAKVN